MENNISDNNNIKTLKWKKFDDHLIELNNVLWVENQFFDVIIVTHDGIEIKAHQLLLSTASDFLRDIFLSSKNIDGITKIVIPDASHFMMETLLQFIYTGEVSLDKTNITGFFDLCDMLKIKSFYDFNKLSNDELNYESNEYENESVFMYDPLSEATIDKIILNEEEMSKGDNDDDDVSYVEIVCNNDDEKNYDNSELVSLNNNDDTINSINSNDSLEENNGDCNENSEKNVQQSKHRVQPTRIKTYDANVLAKAFDEIKLGTALREVAKKYNIPQSSLYMKYKRTSLSSEKPSRPPYRNQIKDAVEAVLTGELTLQKASKNFKVPKTVLWRKLHKSQLYKPEKYVMAPARIDAIEALMSGESLIYASQKYKIPISTLYRDKVRLYKNGQLPENSKIKTRETGKEFKERVQKAVEACKEGMSQNAASFYFSVPKTTVWRYMKLEKNKLES